MARNIEIQLVGDSRDLERAFGRAAKAGSSFGSAMTKAGKAAAIALGGGLALAAVGAKKTIDAAKNLGESMNAVNVVFGKSSKQIHNFGKVAAREAGLSMRQFNELVTPIGASLQNVGFSADQAAKASINLGKRAADMASVFNVDVSDAMAAIQAGLRGEADPLERFGVGLSAAAVNAKAMSMELAKNEAALTANDKAQARLALLMEQTNKVAGDFARTSDQAANKERILAAQRENDAARIGQALIPAYTALLNIAGQVIPKVMEFASALAQRVGPAVESLVADFRRWWPEIRRVAVSALDGISAAIAGLARFAQEHWPKVRAAAEAVARWYRDNLEPTITSVARNIAGAWEKALADMEKDTGSHTRRTGGIITTWLGSVVSGINAALAGIRGDWETMWDNLKSMAAASLRTIVALVVAWRQTLKGAVNAAVPAVRDAAMNLGRAIGQGVADGIRQTPGMIRDAIGGVLDGALSWAKDKIKASSPSLVYQLQVGKPIADGIAAGIKAGKVTVTDAMRDLADAALSAAQTRMQGAFGRFSALAGQAFSGMQSGQMTPTEQLIAGIDLSRQKEALERSLAEAEAARDGSLDAERAYGDAAWALMRFNLERQAEEERKQLDARQFVQNLAFQEQLAKLQEHLESGKLTTKQATAAITALLKRFGITAGSAAAAAGAAIAKALQASVPAIAAATAAIRAALGNVAVLGSAPEPTTGGGGGGTGGGGGGSLVALGRQLQADGYQVGEHPAFGGVTPGVHVAGSYHYAGRALDINADGPNEMARLDALYTRLRAIGGWSELLWRTAGHYDHLHVALGNGGIVTGPTRALIGERGPEAVIPLNRAGALGGITVNVYGWVGDEADLTRQIRDSLVRHFGRESGGIFAGYA